MKKLETRSIISMIMLTRSLERIFDRIRYTGTYTLRKKNRANQFNYAL